VQARDNYAIVSLKGACIHADWRIFFLPSRYSEALKYCAACPVARECRELCAYYDREYYVTDGVWAGTTPKIRQAERQRARYQEWLAEQAQLLCALTRKNFQPIYQATEAP
jgi:hypothetical protein